MSDDFPDIEDLLDDDNSPNRPSWRATVRRGRLTVTSWAPWLATEGPIGNLFRLRRADVTIADLTIEGEDEGELLISFLCVGRDRSAAEQVLLDWAAHVGYRRVWLPDRLVEIEPSADQVGKAEVRCATCLATWRDGTPNFWAIVRKQGMFPKWCPLCGAELHQWTVLADDLRQQSRRRSDSGENKEKTNA